MELFPHEVKTTRSGRNTPFVLTRNEIRISIEDPVSCDGDLEVVLELAPTQFSGRMRPQD